MDYFSIANTHKEIDDTDGDVRGFGNLRMLVNMLAVDVLMGRLIGRVHRVRFCRNLMGIFMIARIA
jgi:hypothetical protein